MSTGIQSDWRDVIRAYLDAAWEDQRRRHAADRSGCEAMCLKEFASEAVWREHQQLIQRRIEALEERPPEAAYELVEESADRAIAQIIPKRLSMSIPFVTTRFVLEMTRSAWKLVEIWQACYSCNPLAMPNRSPDMPLEFQPGRCFLCHGSGRGTVPKTVGLWIFRRTVAATGECSFCHGTGTCTECDKSGLPGWKSAYSTHWFDRHEAGGEESTS